MIEDKKVLDSDSLIAVREFVEGQVKPLNKNVKELSDNVDTIKNEDIRGINDDIDTLFRDVDTALFALDDTIRIKTCEILEGNGHTGNNWFNHLFLHIVSEPISRNIYESILTTDRVVLRLNQLKQQSRRKNKKTNWVTPTRLVKKFCLPDNWDFFSNLYYQDITDEQKNILKNLFAKYHWIVITPEMLKKDRHNRYIIDVKINLLKRTLSQVAEYNDDVPSLNTKESNTIENAPFSVITKSWITTSFKISNDNPRLLNGGLIGHSIILNEDRLRTISSSATPYKRKSIYNIYFSSSNGTLYLPDNLTDIKMRRAKQRMVHNFRPEWLFNLPSYLTKGQDIDMGQLSIPQLADIIASIVQRPNPMNPNHWAFSENWSLIMYNMIRYWNSDMQRYFYKFSEPKIKNARYKEVIRELIRPDFAILAEDWNNLECKHIWEERYPMAERIFTVTWDERFSWPDPRIAHTLPIVKTHISYSIQDLNK